MATTESKSGRAAKAAADATTKATRDMTDAAFAYPSFEVPEAFRSFAEQGLAQTRDAYARVKANTEEATDMIESSFETTRESMREVQIKALDVAQANAEATFDHLRKLFGVTSLADAFQLQSTFARERFEAYVDYSKDVQSTLTKVGADVSKPAKTMFDRALSVAKAA